MALMDIGHRRSKNVCAQICQCVASLLLLIRIMADERDRAKYEGLHRSIRACDDILGSVETNLESFRNDLAAVSADIESLQARSTALNVRLENRKAVEKGLGSIVEELSVSPLVVSKISEGHIDESWLKVLVELDRRAMIYKKNANKAQSKASSDLGPLLEKLTLKVRLSVATSVFLPDPYLLIIRNRLSRGYGTFSWRRSRH